MCVSQSGALEALHLFFLVTAFRETGGCLLLFVGLALLRSSQHMRILCIALIALAPTAAEYSHTWLGVRRRRESTLIFSALLAAMLRMRETVEES